MLKVQALFAHTLPLHPEQLETEMLCCAPECDKHALFRTGIVLRVYEDRGKSGRFIHWWFHRPLCLLRAIQNHGDISNA